MISNLFAPLAMKIAAGLLALALVFGGVQTLRLSWAHTEIAKAERDRERAVAKAVEKARSADAVGVGTAQAGNDAVEQKNEAAREAARDSEDPLRAGMEALR